MGCAACLCGYGSKLFLNSVTLRISSGGMGGSPRLHDTYYVECTTNNTQNQCSLLSRHSAWNGVCNLGLSLSLSPYFSPKISFGFMSSLVSLVKMSVNMVWCNSGAPLLYTSMETRHWCHSAAIKVIVR